MQSYTCKAKKGERSSESEQPAEIRIQNPEQWIYLAVKKKINQSSSAKCSQNTSVLLCQESRYIHISWGQT